MTTIPPTRIGKTTVAACVGLSFAQVRQDDRVVAIHADTAFGTLGARVGPRATGSLWDLACQHRLDEGLGGYVAVCEVSCVEQVLDDWAQLLQRPVETKNAGGAVLQLTLTARRYAIRGRRR